ncbi:MAG TPA: histidine kinase [Marmoricola sp.]|nr:histidine kinase [Marmoricola sp.]
MDDLGAPRERELWARNDRPIPAAYWMAASLAALVVLVSYATAWWVPWFVRDMADYIPAALYPFGAGLVLTFSTVVGLALAATAFVALRWPALAIALALLPVAATVLDPYEAGLHFGVFASLCAIALTASWRDARASVVAAGAAATVILGWIVSGGRMAAPFRSDIDQRHMDHEARMVTLLLYLVVVLVVVAGAYWLRRSAEREIQRRGLAARAGQVEEQAAVVQERARLARDLHDVVAHHVSLIAVRAETAPYTHPEIGDQARGVLGDIAADARLALDELRGVLGILGRTGEAERSPQPTWSDIAALVERTRSAGVDVEVVGDTTAEVGPSAGYAAYRVVQEALTNARKHAPGARVVLDLEATSHLLTILVSTPLAASASPASPGGRGLVGMRERVEALGGRLLSGPVGEDFVVEAILPRAAA